MDKKKNRERFSIKFNENDPAHDAVIRLLEKQGAHSKAQFIVNAVLHYVNCADMPNVFPVHAVDKESIEKIVWDVLRKNDGYADAVNDIEAEKRIKEERIPAESSIQSQKPELNGTVLDENTWAMIADSMSAFRNS